MLTDDKLTRMLETAKATGPGDWYSVELAVDADRKHIAECDPGTITALVTEVLALRAEVERLKTPEAWWLMAQTMLEPKDGAK